MIDFDWKIIICHAEIACTNVKYFEGIQKYRSEVSIPEICIETTYRKVWILKKVSIPNTNMYHWIVSFWSITICHFWISDPRLRKIYQNVETHRLFYWPVQYIFLTHYFTWKKEKERTANEFHIKNYTSWWKTDIDNFLKNEINDPLIYIKGNLYNWFITHIYNTKSDSFPLMSSSYLIRN